MRSCKMKAARAGGRIEQIIFKQDRPAIEDTGTAELRIRQNHLCFAIACEAKKLTIHRKMTIANRESQDLFRQKRRIHIPRMLLGLWQAPILPKNRLSHLS